LIAKARDLVGKTDRVGELTDILLKLEARIQTADKSKELLDKKRIKYGILAYNLCFAIIALGVGWWAICGPYLPCRSCDNSTQSAVATPAPQSSGQASVQGPEQNPAGNPMEKIKALTLVNWLVLGFAAGTLGGAMVGIYGLIYHGIRGDFSSDYLVWYWSKPFKGGLSGLVAILPFMAGLAVFKIESAVEVQTTIAYITVVSFLTGYNERYFLQLLNTVGKTVFGPGETNGGTDSAITKPG
jgi:hypothetical protein